MSTQIPHLEKKKTSLEPAVKGAKMFLGREKRSPTRCTYYEARGSAVPVRAGEELVGMTAMAGMMTYLELMHAAGLRSSVERHVGLRECGQGWTDSQVVSSLILLNLAGGESVVDLDVLEKDAGLCRVLREVESYGMGRRERRALEERWRVERRRSMPSESAVFRYLERFHEAGEESSREAHRAFIPSRSAGGSA